MTNTRARHLLRRAVVEGASALALVVLGAGVVGFIAALIEIAFGPFIR